ncbi:MAG: hypothetical protein U5N58_08235 [Actinomycetota bacterium]|nr:hypothetical protein [Actinomycetota bacterium]
MKYSNKHFGQALYEQIKSKNIKLRSLANKTNLNYSYFSKLIKKSKPPPVETMEIIASGLDIAPDYFLEYRLYKLNQLLTSSSFHCRSGNILCPPVGLQRRFKNCRRE